MSCSSDSEEEKPWIPSTWKSTAFSIDNLLDKKIDCSVANKCQWDVLLKFQNHKVFNRQVCAMPANIVLPLDKKTYEEQRSERSETAMIPTGDIDRINLLESGESSQSNNIECGISDEGSHFKKKRPRTAFSATQVRLLESEFEKNRYLTGSKRKELSRELKLSETQIKIWFQNRRTKLKRKNVSEMETWVQQLYSPLGPMAPRPLIIGDHLYLFNTNRGDAVCQHFQQYPAQIYPSQSITLPGYLPYEHKLPKPFE